MEVQVPNAHYNFFNYISAERWMSYRHQLELIMKSGCKKILIIGLGDNIIPAILKAEGFDVETCDIDETLKPDHLQSLTELDLKGRTYELVLCCQVLEHIPFEQIENVLTKLQQITKNQLIISLPEKALRVSFMMKFPRIKNFYLNLVIPLFFKPHRFDGQHYWELGTLENYRKLFLDTAGKKFSLASAYRFKPNPYHHFFIFKSL